MLSLGGFTLGPIQAFFTAPRPRTSHFGSQIVSRNIMYSIEYILGHCKIWCLQCQKFGQNMIPPHFFVPASYQSVIPVYLWSFWLRHILYSDDLWVILAFFGLQKCLFSTFLINVHFLRNSYVETVQENSKMKGKAVKRF